MTDRRIKGVASGLSAAGIFALLVVGVLGAAGPAAAGSVLFRMNSGICGLFNDPGKTCSGRPMPQVGGTVSGPTLMTTPNATGGADFTIPSKLYSQMGSFSSTYLPVYPYFQASFTRYNKGGSIMAGNWAPNATYTFYDPNTPAYPNVTATDHDGFLRANVGPKGMAGPNVFLKYSFYTAQIATPLINYQTAVIDVPSSAAGSPDQTQTAGWLYTYNPYNQTNTGIVVFREPSIWAMTGTITFSQPNGAPFPNEYEVRTAMDNRTPAGASGTIQVISASLSANYTVTPLPPAADGSGTATSLRNALMNGRKTTFEFIPAPEPGQLALIGMGVVGLAGAWGMRRRR